MNIINVNEGIINQQRTIRGNFEPSDTKYKVLDDYVPVDALDLMGSIRVYDFPLTTINPYIVPSEATNFGRLLGEKWYDSYMNTEIDYRIKVRVNSSYTRYSEYNTTIIESLIFPDKRVGVKLRFYPDRNYFCGHLALFKVTTNNSQHIIPGTKILLLSPLAILMVKREYVDYLKACILTRTKPSEKIFELWISKELDRTDSPHQIRKNFVTAIKQPLKKAGVTIKIFDNLEEEILVPNPKLNFESLSEVRTFIQTVINQTMLTDDHRRISTTREQIETTPLPF